MATIAGFLDRLMMPRTADATASRAGNREREAFRLRPIASEDVFFFTKRVDNSRVVRQADPHAGRTQAWMIGGSIVSALALVAVMLPALSTAVDGYKIEALRQEKSRLVNERAALELAEERYVSTQHLQELARRQKFIDPDPQNVVYLEARQENTIAGRIVPFKDQAR